MNNIIKVGVSGILIRDGRVLLGKRLPDDEALPNMYCSPGGRVEYKETLEAALFREFNEETGLHIHVHHLFSIEEGFSENGHTVMPFYIVTDIPPIHSPIAGDGFSLVGWYSVDDLIEIRTMITGMSKKALSKYFDVNL